MDRGLWRSGRNLWHQAALAGRRSVRGLQWVWFGIALGAVTHLLLRNLLSGRFGRAFLSLQADEIAAESVGVSVYRYKILAFVIAAVTCGIAGAMVAQQNQYLNSDFISFQLSIFILLLVLFGGSGSLYGPLIGAISLTLIDALLARWPAVQHFAYGGLLLFALYAMPNGVAGLFSRFFTKRSVIEPVPATQKQPATAPIQRNEDRSRPLLDVTSVSKISAASARRTMSPSGFSTAMCML